MKIIAFMARIQGRAAEGCSFLTGAIAPTLSAQGIAPASSAPLGGALQYI